MASRKRSVKHYSDPSKELLKAAVDVTKIGVTLAATGAILGTTASVVNKLK